MDSFHNPTETTTKLINVISCGPTGDAWDGSGQSIGVNDCVKFGKQVHDLVIVNPVSAFNENRLRDIKKSKPNFLYTNFTEWLLYVDTPNMIGIFNFHWPKFFSLYDRKEIYRSYSSTMIAASIAFNQGATDIVLWGSDFVNHQNIKGDQLVKEISNWRMFKLGISKKNCNLWLGTESKVLSQFIPVYENSANNANQR